MKIAYLILTHQNPALLQKAIGILSSRRAGFFVHVDLKAELGTFSAISGENVFFLEQRVPVYWAEFSQVDATLQLMREALAAPVAYDYFVFIQGSDFPL